MYQSTASLFCPKDPQSGAGDMEMRGVRLFVRYSVSQSVCSRYFVSALRFLCVHLQKKPFCLGCYLFRLSSGHDVRRNTKECDSDKCDLKIAAIAAIIIGILAAIFNMVAKTHKQFRSDPMLQLHSLK
jgi:hypothetical protein